MDFVLIVRLVIFVTFLLLLAEGIAAIFLAKRALAFYIKKHKELEIQEKFSERRLTLIENHLGLIPPKADEETK